MGGGPFSLVGHDSGGVVARLIGVHAPADVRAMVIMNTEIPGHRPRLVPMFQRMSRLPGALWMMSQGMRVPFMLRGPLGFGGCFCDRELIFSEFQADIVAPLIHDPTYLAGMVAFLESLDWKCVDELGALHARIQAKVHLLWGEQDPFFPIDRARPMLEQFAQPGEFVSIPGTKLLPFYEKPDLVAAHIRRLLGAGIARSQDTGN